MQIVDSTYKEEYFFLTYVQIYLFILTDVCRYYGKWVNLNQSVIIF